MCLSLSATNRTDSLWLDDLPVLFDSDSNWQVTGLRNGVCSSDESNGHADFMSGDPGLHARIVIQFLKKKPAYRRPDDWRKHIYSSVVYGESEASVDIFPLASKAKKNQKNFCTVLITDLSESLFLQFTLKGECMENDTANINTAFHAFCSNFFLRNKTCFRNMLIPYGPLFGRCKASISIDRIPVEFQFDRNWTPMFDSSHNTLVLVQNTAVHQPIDIIIRFDKTEDSPGKAQANIRSAVSSRNSRDTPAYTVPYHYGEFEFSANAIIKKGSFKGYTVSIYMYAYFSGEISKSYYARAVDNLLDNILTCDNFKVLQQAPLSGGKTKNQEGQQLVKAKADVVYISQSGDLFLPPQCPYPQTIMQRTSGTTRLKTQALPGVK